MRTRASTSFTQWPSDRPFLSNVKSVKRRNGPDVKLIQRLRHWQCSAKRGNPLAGHRNPEREDPVWSTPKIKCDRGWNGKILRGKISTAITKVISPKRKLTRPSTRRDEPASRVPVSISTCQKERNNQTIAEVRRASSYLCRLHRWMCILQSRK